MRRCLETAVTAAIDLFQMVDKAQLSLLGATTDLTGPLVERMIERYITEQLHETVLFPRLCRIRKLDDVDLETNIRQMTDLDVSQVGIPVGESLQERQELSVRLQKGVETFKNMGGCGSPHEMLEALLATQKLITTSESALQPLGRRFSYQFPRTISHCNCEMLMILTDVHLSKFSFWWQGPVRDREAGSHGEC